MSMIIKGIDMHHKECESQIYHFEREDEKINYFVYEAYN